MRTAGSAPMAEDREDKVDYEKRARKLAPLLDAARARIADILDDEDDDELRQPTPVMPARRTALEHFADAQRVDGYAGPSGP